MADPKRVLAALAEPTRQRLLERIAHKPSAVGELADNLPISQSAVSQHLKVLRDAQLVHVRKEGTRRVYSPRKEGIEALRRYVDQFWGGVLEAYAAHDEEAVRDEAGRDEAECDQGGRDQQHKT